MANIETPVTITEGAVKQLMKIMKEEKVTDKHGLRVGVKGGGCSGFTYILGFDEKKENDDEFISGGLRIIMDKAHAIYLVGIEIDFADDLQNRGFTFNNPNAKESCGCGTSFSA
ncbi:MAG: iron-sulfur cluster assembly accessory protein [Saprospiraceae bacterium]|nr:iron-sulfur cluster assembly accessory protein [Saprospiraceae bacterium]